MPALVIDLSGQKITGDEEMKRAMGEATEKALGKRRDCGPGGSINFNLSAAILTNRGYVACDNCTGSPPNNLPTDQNSGHIVIKQSNLTIIKVGAFNQGNHADDGLEIVLDIRDAVITETEELFCRNIAWN